jgi:ketosteroid isomerase-like protein
VSERQAAAEAKIRGLTDARINAIRAKDVEGATSNVAHNVVVFDVVDAFLQVGIEAMRARASSHGLPKKDQRPLDDHA